jgi:cardiolipin synthase
VRLIIQPGEGTKPLVKAISRAKNRIDIVIFRFDQKEIERALGNAVNRGVSVHALIASKNRAGEENLRELEMRLLGAGVTVARTGDDLIRYHSKVMIVDRRELFVLAFNLTRADMERSRSFGVITSKPELVREAEKLFEADSKRAAYESSIPGFIVSPVNARKELSAFLQGAKRELSIYDPQVSDRAMIRVLAERAKAGVRVRVIGRLLGKVQNAEVHKVPNMRLHTRTILRDGNMAFVGSQSLRAMELDERREVGLIFREPKVIRSLVRTFESDWETADRGEAEKAEDTDPSAKIAKRVAKAVARELPAVAPLVTGAVQEAMGKIADVELVPGEVEAAVKGAVKEAVKEMVRNAVDGAVERSAGSDG